MRNFYHILGLSFEAQPENQVISAAYKALVKLYHPDVFKGEKKEQKRKISEINEAYEILNNHESKLKYDIDCMKDGLIIFSEISSARTNKKDR